MPASVSLTGLCILLKWFLLFMRLSLAFFEGSLLEGAVVVDVEAFEEWLALLLLTAEP